MFREMFLVTGLQKIKQKNAAACPAEKVLQMAVQGGAEAMGLYDCNELRIGKKADLIVIDMHMPNMQPVNNIVKNIVYSGSKENVALTMVAGKVLYERGMFLTVSDPERVYRDAAAIIARMRGTLGR